MKDKTFRIPFLLSLLTVFLMVGAAELFGEKEIIFPEIAALAIGALYAPRQPWNCNKLHIVGLVTFYACLGVLLARFVPLPTFSLIILAFPLCGLGLIVTRCTFVPLISAAILPILLGSTSWVYPLSAFLLALLVALLQALQEKMGVRARPVFVPQPRELKTELKDWLLRWVIVAALAPLVLYIRMPFYIAPPLLVAFVELSRRESPLRKRPAGAAVTVMFCAFEGALCRLFFSGLLHLPLVISALAAAAALLLFMQWRKLYFPPAGALAILPMLIDASLLTTYPFQVSGGIIFLTVCAIALFDTPPAPAAKSEDDPGK